MKGSVERVWRWLVFASGVGHNTKQVASVVLAPPSYTHNFPFLLMLAA